MKEINEARMGIITILALMLVSIKRRLPATRRLSPGITTLTLAGIVLLVAAGGASANGVCVWGGGPDDYYECGGTVYKSCTFNASMICTDNTKPGLYIGADDIVIDGAGFNITGVKDAAACAVAIYGPSPGETAPAKHSGIVNGDTQSYDNVVVKNLEITNFCTGVVLGDGLNCYDVDNNTVTECYIHDCGDSSSTTHGIHVVRANNCNMTKNEITNIQGTGVPGGCTGGGNGIFMYGDVLAERGWYNTITCNYLHGNEKSGFFMKHQCMHCTISYNNATDNTEGGIMPNCKQSSFNEIEYNNMSGNGIWGMYCNGNANTIRYNTAHDNGNIGIELGGMAGVGYGGNNSFVNNSLCGNPTDIVVGVIANNTGDSNTCDIGPSGWCDWDCTDPVSTYFDFDGDTYYSDDPANCACGVAGSGKCACCNPGLFNGSHATMLNGTSPAIVWLTAGDDINDCDPGITSAVNWYCDGDSDGYINSSVSGSGAPGDMPPGCQFAQGNDCDDTNAAVNPGATEICDNGIDDDCDGDIDCDDLYCKPDLDITVKKEEWINDTHYNVNYTVCNIGICQAGISNTTIYIDETRIVVEDPVGTLNQNQCDINTVGPFLWTGPSDNVTVCADNDGQVDEKDETNNCEINTLSAQAADIFIDQPEYVDPQSQFTIKIMVDPHDIDISAIQYDLYYDTSVVWAEWANPGSFLKQGGATTDVTVRSIDNLWDTVNHVGKITYAETTLGSGGTLPSVNTPGILTTIHFSAIGVRGTYSVMDLDDVLISDPEKERVQDNITDCGVTIYDNQDPVANGTSMYRFSNVASKFQCFAVLCPCLSDGGSDLAGWGENITYVRWDFGDGQYGTSEGIDPCEVRMHEYTTWNWDEVMEEYDPFTAYLTVRDDGEPQLSNTTEVEVMVYIAGDTNGDGVVDIFDAACVGKHWGQHATGPVGTCDYYWTIEQADEADLNNDNDVDTLDAMIVGTNWNHLAYPPYYQE